MVILFGFAATVKNIPDIFFHLNHGSSFLEHAEHNSPCSSLQSTLSTYAKCIIAVPSGVTLEEGMFVPKNFKLFTVVYS